MDGSVMKRQTLDGCPEVEGIALGAASEAAVNLPGEMDREGPVRSRRAAGDRAGATKLRAASPSRAEADQAQHLGHGDLPAKLLVIDARHEGFGGEVF
jgi:hypothetical protein